MCTERKCPPQARERFGVVLLVTIDEVIANPMFQKLFGSWSSREQLKVAETILEPQVQEAVKKVLAPCIISV